MHSLITIRYYHAFYLQRIPCNTSVSVVRAASLHCDILYIKFFVCWLLHVLPDAAQLRSTYTFSWCRFSWHEFDQCSKTEWDTKLLVCRIKADFDFEDADVTVALAGIGAAGKSTVLHQLNSDQIVLRFWPGKHSACIVIGKISETTYWTYSISSPLTTTEQLKLHYLGTPDSIYTWYLSTLKSKFQNFAMCNVGYASRSRDVEHCVIQFIVPM